MLLPFPIFSSASGKCLLPSLVACLLPYSFFYLYLFSSLFRFDNFMAPETFIIRFIEPLLDARSVCKSGVNKMSFLVTALVKKIFFYTVDGHFS